MCRRDCQSDRIAGLDEYRRVFFVVFESHLNDSTGRPLRDWGCCIVEVIDKRISAFGLRLSLTDVLRRCIIAGNYVIIAAVHVRLRESNCQLAFSDNILIAILSHTSAAEGCHGKA